MTAASPGSRKGLALALLALTQFVIVLDASIVNVALPSIGRALDFNQDDLSWVVNAYTLTFGGFLLLGGRLADLLGRRRVFIAGLILFSLASLAGGLAQSDVWLIAARGVQGLGAAIISPAALSLVTTMFAEGAERNRALGVWGAVAGSGGAAGVLLGGILTQYAGWEWVLFVNVPIGFLAAFLAPRLLPESRDTERDRVFDVAGATTVTAGLALLVYTLVDANNAGWGSTQTIVLGAISRRCSSPPSSSSSSGPATRSCRSRSSACARLRGADVVGLLIGMSLFAMFFFLSLYMQQVLGYDALKTGVRLPPARAEHHRQRRRRLAARDADRLQADADRRDAADRGRARLVRPGLADRRLRVRRAVPVARRRVGPRPGVRAGHDRRRDRDAARRGRPRVGPHQHRPAGRRRARPRDPRRGRQRPHERRHRLGRAQPRRRAHARASRTRSSWPRGSPCWGPCWPR